MAGVKDMSEVVLLEDPASRERNIAREQRIAKAYEAILGIRREVDKLVEKVMDLDFLMDNDTKVADQEFVILTELLMMQLLKLDAIEAEDEAKDERRIEVYRIQHFVEKLDALKMAARNPNPISNSCNGTSNTTQWQTFDSGRGEDVPVMIREANTSSRVRPREPSRSHTGLPSSAHRHKRPRHMESPRASTDWSTSTASEQLSTPDGVPFEPILSVDVEPTISEGFETDTSSVVATDSIIPDTLGPSTGAPLSLDASSTPLPGETSMAGELGHTEALAIPAHTSTGLDISAVPSFPPMDAPLCHIGTSSSSPEGGYYESEIFCRLPSAAGSRHERMQDSLLMFLRELISNLDPGSPESLDRFISDANAFLDFLAHLGLDEVDLRYWEAQCREIEFLIRQLKSLSIVPSKTSLSELRQRVRLRQETANIARDEYSRSVEAMQRHHDKSTNTAVEMESLSSKINSLQGELTSLMSYRNDIQVKCECLGRVIEREQHLLEIRQRAMMDAKDAFNKAVENLQAAEAEHQSLATFTAQLRDLQTRLI